MKAPHKVAGGGRGKQHPGKGPVPGKKGPAPPKPAPPHHKKPPPPKKAPKPKPAPPHRKPRRLSPGSDLACCSAQALGTLLGWDWEQVLALYRRTAGDSDSGASIEGTLRAANSDLDFAPVVVAGAFRAHEPAVLSFMTAFDALPHISHGLILGVTLPESHAIAVTPDGTWWSWGQPFNPADWPDLVIEEAWCLP